MTAPQPEHLAVLYRNLRAVPVFVGKTWRARTAAQAKNAGLSRKIWPRKRVVLGRTFTVSGDDHGTTQTVSTDDWSVTYFAINLAKDYPDPDLTLHTELKSFTGDFAIFVRDVFFVRMAH